MFGLLRRRLVSGSKTAANTTNVTLCRRLSNQIKPIKANSSLKLVAATISTMSGAWVIHRSVNDSKKQPANQTTKQLTKAEESLLNDYLAANNISLENTVIISQNPTNQTQYFTSHYPAPFELDGQHWSSVEHYLEFQKTKAISKLILTPKDKEKNLNDLLPLEWRTCSPQGKGEALAKATFAKFNQNPWLAKKLLGTGDKHIIAVSTNPAEKSWTIAKAKTDDKHFGYNGIGKILMDVRAKLAAEPKKRLTYFA